MKTLDLLYVIFSMVAFLFGLSLFVRMRHYVETSNHHVQRTLQQIEQILRSGEDPPNAETAPSDTD